MLTDIYGAREDPRVIAEYGGVYSDPEVEAAVARVVSRLVAASDDPSRRYKITILNSPVANAFALIGLRALFFLVKGLLDRLVYLSTGLALILALIGVVYLLIGLYTLLRQRTAQGFLFYLWCLTSALLYLLTPTPTALGTVDGLYRILHLVDKIALSLLPALKLRLGSFGHLVDISRIAELEYVKEEKGVVRIGAGNLKSLLVLVDLSGVPHTLVTAAIMQQGVAESRPHVRARAVYGEDLVYERHRHRYEFNPRYRSRFEEAGFVCSGTSPDGRLVEFIELPAHPYWVGTQAHPEFKSRPDRAAPLFDSFVEAAHARAEGRSPHLFDLVAPVAEPADR